MMSQLKKDVLFYLTMADGHAECNDNVFTKMLRNGGHGTHITSHVLRVLESEGKARYDVALGWVAC